MIFAQDALNWLSRSTGITSRDLNITQLKGSTSSSVFCVQHSRGLTTQRFVLRVIDNQEWLAEEPDLAAHEAAALHEAQQAKLPAPRLVAYAKDDVGFGSPVVLMSFVTGTIVLRPEKFQPWLASLAHQLALIHQHPAEDFPWSFRSWVSEERLALPRWTAAPQLWERAIDLIRGPVPDVQPVFIHRDYHPLNVLWHRGAISGVVDWINACRGPAMVDTGHCRVNLALMFSPAVANQFLAAYRAIMPEFTNHPYWDLDAILDMCLPQPIFYEPWQVFGLEAITPEMLRHRADTYLESVMKQL